MSRFAERFAATALPALMEEMGDPATYHRPQHDDAAVTAIVEGREAREFDGQRGIDAEHSIIVVIATDPAGAYGGVELPTTRDEMTIGLDRFAVRDVIAVCNGTARLRLVRVSAAERTRARYRAGR